MNLQGGRGAGGYSNLKILERPGCFSHARPVISHSRAFALHAVTGFAVGLAGAAAIEGVLIVSSQQAEPVSREMLQSLMARALLYGTPLAMLPALWYARTRDGLPSASLGMVAGAIGILLTLLVAGWVTPIGIRAYNLQTLERVRRNVEESARVRRTAGSIGSPGSTGSPGSPGSPGSRGSTGSSLPRPPQRRTLVPPLRPLTPAQAVAADPTAKTWPDLLRSAEEDPSRARSYQLESRNRLEIAALAGVLAFLGWTLGSLHRSHALHPVMWWGMIWLLTLATAGSRVGTSLVVFGIAAMTLSMVSRTPAAASPAAPEAR